jgi:ComF family protein
MPDERPGSDSDARGVVPISGLPISGLKAALSLKRAVRAVLDLVVPMACVECGTEGSPLCERCERGLPRLRRPQCTRCAEPNSPLVCRRCSANTPAFDRIIAPYLAQGSARELVHRLKYNDARAYAERIAGLLADFLRYESVSGDLIVPVPLHPSKERRRGYNQSGLIAQDLGRLMGIEVDARSLRRVRKGAAQVTASTAHERRTGVQDAFECEPVGASPIAGARVLLVDDVVTTGATMSDCARALKAAGAETVLGVAFTRQAQGRA